MKRQWFITYSGFTIFELMIVITILWVFFVITGSFDWSPQTDMEKADRMVVWISSQLRTEIQNVLIGKMPKLDGKISTITKIQVSSGWIITSYFTGSNSDPIGSNSFINPFYDGDSKYQISGVAWTGSDTPSLTYSGYADLIIQPPPYGISFSGVNASNASIESNIFLEITVSYDTRSRKITLDRRTGKITESKN